MNHEFGAPNHVNPFCISYLDISTQSVWEPAIGEHGAPQLWTHWSTCADPAWLVVIVIGYHGLCCLGHGVPSNPYQKTIIEEDQRLLLHDAAHMGHIKINNISKISIQSVNYQGINSFGLGDSHLEGSIWLHVKTRQFQPAILLQRTLALLVLGDSRSIPCVCFTQSKVSSWSYMTLWNVCTMWPCGNCFSGIPDRHLMVLLLYWLVECLSFRSSSNHCRSSSNLIKDALQPNAIRSYI